MPDSKAEQIDRVKANLPLPDDPPGASDLNSLDERTVNVGTGRTGGNAGTADVSTAGLGSGPDTKRSEDMDMSNIGRPEDARSK